MSISISANTPPQAINRRNLYQLPAHIQLPTYTAQETTTGIVHIGVGGFHRAHQAMYTDALMNRSDQKAWGICGIGLREADRSMQNVLQKQDHLYTLVEQPAEGQPQARVIGAITDFLMATDSPAAVIEKLAEPNVKVVSLTITEGGYNMDTATGEFISTNPDVQHDLANPDTPRLVFGYLLAALRRRRERALAPFTLLSCDNIQHNGDVLKHMLLSFIRLSDVEMAEWVAHHVSFPNNMVDRITPSTTEADRQALLNMGVEDSWPVVSEPFCQWIIEDDFVNGRPAWELVGAQFVPSVAPYEKLKLRMLNAGHSVLGLCGALAGFSTIDASIQSVPLRNLLSAFFQQEVVPTLDPVAGINVSDYQRTLAERFANPNIKDSVTRICGQSSAKIPVFLLPTVVENLQAGRGIHISALVIASWCYLCATQQTQHGQTLDIVDDQAAQLHAAAHRSPTEPLAFLYQKDIFGDLVHHAEFSLAFGEYTNRLFAGESVLSLAASLGQIQPVR